MRTGPDPERLRRREPVPHLRRGRRHLVAYLGVMGPQDGVDLVLGAADLIVHTLGRNDISFTLMGAGDCYDGPRAPTRRARPRPSTSTSPAACPTTTSRDVLSTADVGLCPDPLNPLNDVSTMNKTMEYMAFGLPVVAFDLAETRVSAADAAVYVRPNDVEELRPRRSSTSSTTRRRVPRWVATAASASSSDLAWEHQQDGVPRASSTSSWAARADRGSRPGVHAGA